MTITSTPQFDESHLKDKSSSNISPLQDINININVSNSSNIHITMKHFDQDSDSINNNTNIENSSTDIDAMVEPKCKNNITRITIDIQHNEKQTRLKKYPNFVFILADDMGWGDTSYNNGTGKTSFLDSWINKANTITFWRGYAGSPVCSPSRASILSGRTPIRDCVFAVNHCGSAPAESCSETMPFPNNTFTIANAVKKAYSGYRTAMFGKWHLGDFWLKNNVGIKNYCPMYSNPTTSGFDDWFATQASAPTVTGNCGCFHPLEGCEHGRYSSKAWCTRFWYPNASSNIGVSKSDYKIPGDSTEYLVDQFEQWLTNGKINYQYDNINTNINININSDSENMSGYQMYRSGIIGHDSEIDINKTLLEQPFLVMLWIHPVHTPVLALQEWRDACENGTNCPLFSPVTIGNKTYTSYSRYQLDYFGQVSSMDYQIKRIRDILEEHNLIENTMIWFSSDNGPEGNKGGPFGDRLYPGSVNGLKGRKRDVYEGGIREPTIIEFNGLINNKNGFNSSFPIVTYDLLPTVMDILNVKYPTHPAKQSQWELDGISLVDMFKNPEKVKLREKPIGWKFQGGKLGSAWMDNQWKVVRGSFNCRRLNSDCNAVLYDIEKDPFETKDIKNENKDVFDRMMNQMNQWLINVNASSYYDSRCKIKRNKLGMGRKV